ncbi:hypothetical protein ACJJTC_014053 [Scirpophaga incertulas]
MNQTRIYLNQSDGIVVYIRDHLETFEYEPCCANGDINLDIISENPSAHTSNYLSIMAMNGLKQGVHCPTRLKACLDHFMVKSACMTETFVFDELTDHSPILLMFQNCNINKNNNNQSYNRRKIVNFEGVKKDLAKETWSTLYSTSDANLAAQTLTTSLQKL